MSWESSQTVYVHFNDVIASCEPLPVATLPNLALAAFKFYTHCYRHFGTEFVGKKMYRSVMQSIQSVPNFIVIPPCVRTSLWMAQIKELRLVIRKLGRARQYHITLPDSPEFPDVVIKILHEFKYQSALYFTQVVVATHLTKHWGKSIALGIELIAACNIDSLDKDVIIFTHLNDVPIFDSHECTELFVVELGVACLIVNSNAMKHECKMRMLKPILDFQNNWVNINL